MFLVEVEFYSWYIIPGDIKALYINNNYAVFKLNDLDELYLFLDETEYKTEVVGYTVYENLII